MQIELWWTITSHSFSSADLLFNWAGEMPCLHSQGFAFNIGFEKRTEECIVAFFQPIIIFLIFIILVKFKTNRINTSQHF